MLECTELGEVVAGSDFRKAGGRSSNFQEPGNIVLYWSNKLCVAKV